jgi:serine phosphatase RsbU (regulator of sigma subunit)
MEIHIAVAKTNKYATSSSGDTVEVIERPHGGVSVVLADGQSSGKGAKAVSNMVVRKVITLLSEGVRDGAAARAASDTLYTEKSGRVSATLNIVSADLQSRTLVITRNNPMPVFVANQDEIQVLDEECKPIGTFRDTRPVICEIPLNSGICAVIFSDGLMLAGSRTGEQLDLKPHLVSLLEAENPSPQWIADSLLDCAVQLDNSRPVDDISIVVVSITPKRGDDVRRMSVRLPVN